ncbi:conserved hypothetical protein [Rhodobacteraceae bacterium HTCC2083]|jgi:hypothetical protein|nr:conserved hypothetical protein [Rhodobacteraceae bacterium HTCC2083]
MQTRSSVASQSYAPLYFLASLGAGGLSVTFFMFLMFWVPHPGRPVPIFEDIMAAFQTGGLPMQAAIVIAMVGIAGFVIINLKSLIWNLRAFAEFKKSDGYEKFSKSNAASTELAMPLALAMTVNGLFIVGLVFVPGLWTVIEYLFPAALIVFAGIAFIAFRMIARFIGNVVAAGNFDDATNGSFAQATPGFALAMSAVGMSAPAAMSTVPATVAISLVLSTIVGTIAALYAAIAIISGVISMLRHGAAREAIPTLMITVPLMTVLGIMTLRQNHGLHAAFDVHAASTENLMLTALFLAVQFAFLGLGLVVLKAQGYWKDFLFGEKTSVGSYALVCPFVALAVMGHFFVNKGLVGADVITKFGAAYWGVTALAIAMQLIAIAMVFRLNRQHFSVAPVNAVPAE